MNRDNNFDALRFWAALAVLWSHSFPISSGKGDPLNQLTGQTSIGAVGVLVFFVISGYLITWSYLRSGDAVQFLTSRVLRIFPGLVVLLFLTALLAGPFLTSLTFGEYFSDPLTYRFAYHSLPIWKGNVDELPGVFLANPFPKSVNGSLWTLNYEFRCYLLVLLLGLLRLLNGYCVIGLLIIALAATVLISPSHFFAYHTSLFTAAFLAGATCYFYRPMPNMGLIAFSVFAVLSGLAFKQIFPIALIGASAYLTIILANSTTIKIPYPERFGDLSYGIYIYAFTVQQIFAHLFGASMSWYTNAIVSTPIVLLLAGLSWHIIEKPALTLKSRT